MDNPSPIRVMIVDYMLAVREGLGAFLDSQDDFALVAVARTGLDAVEECADQRPDVVLIELVLPDASGLDVMHALHEIHPKAKVIFLTKAEGPHLVHAAKSAGAAGLLTKGVSGKELGEAIRGAMNGGGRELS